MQPGMNDETQQRSSGARTYFTQVRLHPTSFANKAVL